jgi:hypothetical protein
VEDSDDILLKNFDRMFKLTEIFRWVYECPAPYKRIIGRDSGNYYQPTG